jgi:putative PIN family toxin of toxin-antitoxin system
MSAVTLDTNIYVSAFQFGGKPMEMLQMALDGEIEIAVSEPIIKETLRVLREKFNWQPYDIFDAGQQIRKIARVVGPTETLTIIEHDPPDNRILEYAKVAGSEFIISHDKDLLRLKEFAGISIMQVAEFLALPRGRCTSD